MSTGYTPRETALLALTACKQQGGWSDSILKKFLRDAVLDARDAALATRLCFGVLQTQMLCDHYIDLFSSVKTGKMEEKVLEALRLGVYQLLFMDRIPDSAAVNESVNLTRKYAKNPRAAGLVNAVLRKVSSQREQLSEPEDLATRFSHPQWLVDEFSRRIPAEELPALLAENNSEPELTVQCNTLRTSEDELLLILKSEGIGASRHPWLPGCLTLSRAGDLECLNSFQQGLFYVQDAAAKLAVLAAAPEPGMRVLDTCAAPGGKSFGAAVEMKNQGEVISCDIHPHKKKLLDLGRDRLGLTVIRSETQDGTKRRADFEQAFDLVITDVPCSGLGVIRKKPDIRYKDPKMLAGLPAVQHKILNTAACYVKPGGILLYATCTLLERENEQVVRNFLSQHAEFKLEMFSLPGPFGLIPEGQLTLWPHRHGTDGFFIARMRRSQ